MPAELNSVTRDLLNTLLDRFEQPNRRTVVRLRLSAKEYPYYFTAEDPEHRYQVNATLTQLEQKGLIKLRWAKWERGNWLEAVDLVPEQASQLYALLRRTPLGEQVESLESLLAFETPRAEWHASFLAWAQSQLALHRSVKPLSLNDLRRSRDVLRALSAIAALEQPTLERTLSVRLFNDSKRLEDLRPALINVLRHHDPQAGSYGDDMGALLAAHGLERLPEYVPIAGRLQLQAGTVIDLAVFNPSVALSAVMLRTAMISACAASVVVTVENATSFSELVAVRPAPVLVLYTGGFATPTVIALLQRLRAARPELRFYHWGDCDAGGLRILAHLRSQLGPIAPLLMDRRTFERYRKHGQPLASSDPIVLEQLRVHSLLADCQDLIEALLTAERKLEQEAVSVADVLDALAMPGDAQ